VLDMESRIQPLNVAWGDPLQESSAQTHGAGASPALRSVSEAAEREPAPRKIGREESRDGSCPDASASMRRPPRHSRLLAGSASRCVR
jgi:hypothetical protein